MTLQEMRLGNRVRTQRPGTGLKPGRARNRLVAGLAVGAGVAMSLQAPPAHSQTGQPIPCAEVGQPLVQIPELRSQGKKLRGTVVLTNGMQRMNLQAAGATPCREQDVRQFRGVNAVAPDYPGMPPGGVLAPGQFADPVPGPTLRARVGDLVQLTFLNQISTGGFWKTLDRGERNEGCDPNPSAPYPGPDQFPDCFHGSSTGNIHFHGTHTSPSTTGDNIFIEVRPSIRGQDDQPVVTEASVRGPFEEFFGNCERELDTSPVTQWPRVWSDLPASWTTEQERLLKQYDSSIVNKLWPVDQAQIRAGAWPQYYIGAFPYCFRLPEYVSDTPPPTQASRPVSHVMASHTAAMTSAVPDVRRSLQMGQAPGLHWYHAHKHGSTTINVANGMTGAFVIEGQYDDDLNRFYGTDWSRRQPIMVINQLGTVPNLFAGGGPGAMPFSVNGRLQPKVTMRPGEVQLWRIANTSSRSGAFIVGFSANTSVDPASAGFSWKQIAQDGVQFSSASYTAAGNANPQILLASGNRADLLVKAPANPSGQAQVFNLLVRDAVNGTQTVKNTAVALLTVQVEPGPSVTGRQAEFIGGADYPKFPAFLADIPAEDVKTRKTVTFATGRTTTPPPVFNPNNPPPPFNMHSIDGRSFDGNVGQVVLLNTVEEWKIENRTIGPQIDHPFHIHINPFQIVEVFDPRQTVTNASNQTVPKYVFSKTPTPDPAQCYLDPSDPDTWRDCHNDPNATRIWWDVFPIPAGVNKDPQGNPIIDPKTGKQVVVPGYFRMRSRFVDYTGQYVIHCHILAHEDRGMMTIVQVVPFTTAYSHQ